MKVAGLMRRVLVSFVVLGIAAEWTGAQSGASAGRFAGNFAEVEIVLNDDVGLSDISALPRAPGADLEVIDGERARVQLSTEAVASLVDAGADVTVLRQFALVEGGITQGSAVAGDTSTLATCSGSYIYGENPSNVYITSTSTWYGSGLDFSAVPGGYTILCIDIHYEVRNLDWMLSIVDVAMSDADYPPVYTLVSGWFGMDGDIVQTKTGITHFNGEALSQLWILWAIDYYSTGGYIDYWWIKLYYDEGPPPPPEYCDASGDCSYEYIEDVCVGTIINTSTGCSTGYSDYTGMSTTMKIGTGYPITVVNGYPDWENQCGIWVDWNGDKDFEDASETISVSGTPGPGPYTALLSPPADANLGDTRLRIRILYTGPINPCGLDFGEVEDYTVTVTEAGIRGDFVAPEGVDFRDFAVLAGQWKQAPGVPSADIAPLGGDGTVDWLDLDAQVDNWLAGLGP